MSTASSSVHSHPQHQRCTHAFSEFIRYLEKEKRLSSNTLTSYQNDLHQWLKLGLFDRFPLVAGDHDLTQSLERFELEKLEESTLARRVASLRSFVRFVSLTDPRWEQLLKKLPRPRASLAYPRALSLEDIVLLLNFEPSTALELRNKALLELMYASGLRASEVIGLTWTQIDFRSQVLRVVGKGQKERVVPFSERAAGWLDLLHKQWEPELRLKRHRDLAFINRRKTGLSRMGLWKIVQKRALDVGVEGVHPHAFRHSFATHLLQGGADIRVVQMLLGHESINTTERYIAVAEEDLKHMFMKHHPLFLRN